MPDDPKPQTPPTTARIEVFRPGTFVPMQGEELTFTAGDLRAIADAYDFDTAPAPVVVGHPNTNAPAFGWIMGFEYDATKERLFATLGELDPDFSQAVQDGRYKKVSMSFFAPENSANPQPGSWHPKHVGFLGGAAPAVSGLKNVEFTISQADAVTFEASFGERGFENTSRLFQGLREFFIEKFGREETDKVLPSWEIEWLADTKIEIEKPSHSFSVSPKPKITDPKPDKEKEPIVAGEDKKKLDAREASLAAREQKITHDENVNFAESLVEEGRLLPAVQDKVVALMDDLPNEASVSFSEGGDKLSPRDALRDILGAQPKVVSFGKTDIPPAGDQATANFASDGKDVDPIQLATHNAATKFQAEHPGTDYVTAVHNVS